MVNPTQEQVDSLAKRHQVDRLYGRARFFTACSALLPIGVSGFYSFGFNKSAMVSAVALMVSVGVSTMFRQRAENVDRLPICTSARDIVQARQQLTGPQ